MAIPSEYEGSTITAIAPSAFMDCDNLTSVEIPDTVTSIGNYAFKNCTNLDDIAIPDSVTSVGKGAFENCGKITKMKLPFAPNYFGSLFGADSYEDNAAYSRAGWLWPEYRRV